MDPPQDRIGLARLTQWAFDGVDLTPLRNQLLAQSLLGGARRLPDGPFGDRPVAGGAARRGGAEMAGPGAGGRTGVQHQQARPGGAEKAAGFCRAQRHGGGNTPPIEFLLDGSAFEILTYYPNLDAMGKARLPDHDVAFCAVPADAPGGAWAFHAGVRQLTGGQPVFNLPEAPPVSLDRDVLGRSMGHVPGLRFPPRTERITRERLAEAGVGPMPWIIRPVGSHAGGAGGLAKVDTVGALATYLDRRAETEFYVSEYIDYATPGGDGQFRKYRVVFVGGAGLCLPHGDRRPVGLVVPERGGDGEVRGKTARRGHVHAGGVRHRVFLPP